MTFEKAKKLLGGVTYKPEYRFDLEKNFFGECNLTIVGKVVNAKNFAEHTHIYFRRVFSSDVFEQMTQKTFKEIVRQCCIQFETHEVNEFLKFDGKHVVAPHPGIESDLERSRRNR